MNDRPTVELFRVFFAHHVEASCNGRVNADREIVVDDVARYRVAFFVPVPVLVPVSGVVVVAVRRRRICGAAAAVAIGDGRRPGGRRRQRRRAQLDVPAIQHDDGASRHAVNYLAELFALVTCRARQSCPLSDVCQLRRHRSANVDVVQSSYISIYIFLCRKSSLTPKACKRTLER